MPDWTPDDCPDCGADLACAICRENAGHEELCRACEAGMQAFGSEPELIERALEFAREQAYLEDAREEAEALGFWCLESEDGRRTPVPAGTPGAMQDVQRVLEHRAERDQLLRP